MPPSKQQPTMLLSMLIRRRVASCLRNTQTRSSAASSSTPNRFLQQRQQRRWITPAPKAGDGPLMSRRADRELPHIDEVRFRWRRSLPIFFFLVGTCSIAIFNYQKMSSPIISSTLYALRTSPRARDLLGDEIYFKHQIPWIHGEMNQLHGRINIWFTVKGSRGTGTMRFTSHRLSARGFFETTEWSLTTEDGQKIDLLEGGDPFKGLLGDDGGHAMTMMHDEDEAASTRGFRQQNQTTR